MRFPYTKIEPGKFGPVVELVLLGSSRAVRCEVFVDSGADLSVFDVHTARLLGLNYKKAKKVPIQVGDGDRMFAYLHKVTVLFAGSKFEVPICFSDSLGAGFNLMGRVGFFERFRICFHEKARVVSVVAV